MLLIMSNNILKLNILSQSGALFNGEAKSVGVNTTSGRITILPGHSPLISTLSRGNIDIDTGDEVKIFPTESGVLNIDFDKVTILLSGEILDSGHLS